MAFDKVAIIVGQRLAGTAGGEVIAERCNDERLKLGGGNAADRSWHLGFVLQQGLGDVIAVAHAALIGVRRAHAVAATSKMRPVRSAGEPPAGSAAPPPGRQACPAPPQT